jgi:NAD(P)-dependent dehydrogenase (short-subunit alcohol dehydrogenase family)
MDNHMFDYKPSANLLRDRVILVTGAGTGIGRAVALAAAAHGATLVLMGRSQARLEQAYDAIEAAGHPRPALVPLNLETATVKDYEELAATLDQEFGRLDGLLHNAGILGRLAPIDHYDPETWLKVCQVNLNAPFLLTRACLPLLRRPEQASVLFTSAEVGLRGFAGGRGRAGRSAGRRAGEYGNPGQQH